jgi:hypothetical protein
MSPLDLAFRAEDEAATLMSEHADGEGRRPEVVQVRYT